MTNETSDPLILRLRTLLASNYRGAAARVRMSPQLSYGRHAGPAPYTARHAAVVVLLFRRNERWHVPLTERRLTLSQHAGQISLPGGSVDTGESSQQTALRELYEELGVKDGVTLLGKLADCYVYASDFLITPWVAVARDEPHWRPSDVEVQSVIELPLDMLFDETTLGTTEINRGLLNFCAPCMNIGTACIWGATSVILSELAEVLGHSEVDSVNSK